MTVERGRRDKREGGKDETLAYELLAGDQPPDAIAAMSDELALGATRDGPPSTRGVR